MSESQIQLPVLNLESRNVPSFVDGQGNPLREGDRCVISAPYFPKRKPRTSKSQAGNRKSQISKRPKRTTHKWDGRYWEPVTVMCLGILKGKPIARFKGQFSRIHLTAGLHNLKVQSRAGSPMVSRGFDGGEGVIPTEFLTKVESYGGFLTKAERDRL